MEFSIFQEKRNISASISQTDYNPLDGRSFLIGGRVIKDQIKLYSLKLHSTRIKVKACLQFHNFCNGFDNMFR